MEFLRRPVKDTPRNNARRWRDKFQEEYTRRSQVARESRRNQFREDQIIREEWKRFLERHGEAMRREGITDLDILIEDSLYEQERITAEEVQADVHHLEEQQELENAIQLYEETAKHIICVNCKKATLIPVTSKNIPVFSCPNCRFSATEPCLQQIIHAANAHAEHCDGSLGYGLEPGTDNIIMAACNHCDLLDVFSC